MSKKLESSAAALVGGSRRITMWGSSVLNMIAGDQINRAFLLSFFLTRHPHSLVLQERAKHIRSLTDLVIGKASTVFFACTYAGTSAP